MQLRKARQLLSVTIFLCIAYTFLLLAAIQTNLDPGTDLLQTTPLIEWNGGKNGDVGSSKIARETGTLKMETGVWHIAQRRDEIERTTGKSSKFPKLTNQISSAEHARTHQTVLLRKLKENSMARSNLNQRTTQHHNATAPRRLQLRQRNTKVKFVELTPDFYVYAGFVDMRIRTAPQVKLFVLRSSSKLLRSLVCGFNTTKTTRHDNNKAEGRARVLRTPSTEYEMCENHDKKYGGWIYTCTIPRGVTTDNLPAISVSIHHSENGAIISNEVDVPLQRIQNTKTYPHSPTSLNIPTHNNSSTGHSQNSINNSDSPITKSQASSNSTSTDSNPSTHLTNDSNHHHHRDLTIGVCVPPLHGDISLQRVVNFVEFSRILGASRVFLYIHDISPDILQYLHAYTEMDDSILSLVDWTLPVVEKTQQSRRRPPQPPTSPVPSWELPPSQIVWNRGQLPSIQHCLYTHMASFDWLLFMDIDEMLIPKTTTSWQGLIRDVIGKYEPDKNNSNNNNNNNNNNNTNNNNNNNKNKNNNKEPSTARHHPVALSFESALFRTDPESQAIYSTDYFQKLRRPCKTDTSRRKVLIRPETVYEMGIHHVSKVMDDEAHRVQNVRPTEALVHHYRETEDGEGDDMFEFESHRGRGSVVLDASALPFRERLNDANRVVMGYLANAVSPSQLASS